MWLAAAKGGRWRKMESGLPGNLGHRGKRYFPGLSRTIKLGPSSRSGITIEVVSRSRSSKITASLLTADFPLPSPSIPSLRHEFEQRCAISPVRKFIVRPWLIRRWERIYEPVENRTPSFERIFKVNGYFLSIDSILRVSFLIFFRLLFSGDEEDYIVKEKEHWEFFDNWKLLKV